MRRLVAFMAFGLVFAGALPVSAAQFYFGTTSEQVSREQHIDVGVFLDTQDETINAISGIVQLPTDQYTVDEIRDANSIVPLWIQRPTQGGDTTTTVAFSGIIPGGFRGQGELFSLIITVHGAAGSDLLAPMDLVAEQALLNDGQGTPAETSVSPLTLVLVSAATAPAVPPIVDTDPPDPFNPLVSRDPNLFGNDWFVAFAAQDKGSGIDHFEVRERATASEDAAWTRTESPYQLKDQSRQSFIDVKAVDRAGNERIETVSPLSSPVPWYENKAIWGIIGAIVVCYIVWRLRRNKRKK